ncbi:MAG: CPBP family intramembrane glutamic endopeptidase [Flavobacteriales bacterium]
MRKRIRILALVTLVVMPLIAWLLAWIFSLNFDLLAWFLPENWLENIGVGVVYGVVIAAVASGITELRFMTQVANRYQNLLSNLRLQWFDVFFISICAGVGEEILFRFALQSLIGIWPAALVFVAVHGYLNPKDWRISVYGIFMTVAAAGFGYLTLKEGLLSAIVAHTVVDIYLLSQLKLEEKTPTFGTRYD